MYNRPKLAQFPNFAAKMITGTPLVNSSFSAMYKMTPEMLLRAKAPEIVFLIPKYLTMLPAIKVDTHSAIEATMVFK